MTDRDTTAGWAIEAVQISKAFRPFMQRLRRDGSRDVHVLRGVDLRVACGEVVGLLGSNGVGKTTLLKILATLLHADSGSVKVHGEDVGDGGKRIHSQVGYVLADERSFHWRLTGPQNLEFFGRLHGLAGNRLRSRIEEVLVRLDLATVDRVPVGQYSSGMKQRLAIARSILHRPPILLMDEPTRSIDSTHAAEIWRMVRDDVITTGGSVVVVTHQLTEALAVCNRVAVLAEGRIVLETSTEALRRMTAKVSGFTVGVRGLRPEDLDGLRQLGGVREIKIASELLGEQTLEVYTVDGEMPVSSFMGALTDRGATVCSLRQSAPIQEIVERLINRQEPVR